jgi:hypothetical protein
MDAHTANVGTEAFFRIVIDHYFGQITVLGFNKFSIKV